MNTLEWFETEREDCEQKIRTGVKPDFGEIKRISQSVKSIMGF